MAVLNRRQGLMAIVGSIFGGKEAGKSILESDYVLKAGIKGMASLKTDDYGVELQEGSIHGRPSSIIEELDKQIAQFTKIINGGLEDWQIRQLEDTRNYRRGAELHRIDSLRSMAPHAKLAMVDRLNKQRMREEWIRDASRELRNVTEYKENFLKTVAGKSKEYIKEMFNTKAGSSSW